MDFFRKLTKRSGLLVILKNIGWLFFEKILRMIGGLLVGTWIARELGLEQFGKLNYAAAFAGLFTAIATLGLSSVVVRDLINRKDDFNKILGTAFALQVISGIVSVFLMAAAIYLVRPDDTLAKYLVLIFGLSQILRSSDVIRGWFESRSTMRTSVLVDNAAFLLTTLAKVILLVNGANVLAFAWVGLFESVLICIGLFWVYTRSGENFKIWSWTFQHTKNLLGASWPLILSGLAVTLYMRIDQIMLGQMIGDGAVGVFSAATRLSEVFYFIPIAVSAAVFPSIIKAKNNNNHQFLDKLQKFFNALTISSILICVPLSVMSKEIISLFYGGGYAEAANVFSIHIWACVFVFMGVSGSKWFLAENLQHLSFYRTFAGALLNIVLNVFLIPLYGPVGAAIATVVSQAMACFLFNALMKTTKVLFKMQCKSLISFLPPWKLRWSHQG